MSKRGSVGVQGELVLLPRAGLRLAVSREGQGPALVCLHAIGHGGGDFSLLSAALRGQHELIRIDWPGQGSSPPDQEPASAERYAALLDELLELLHIENPVLLGNSIGGAVALLTAARRPLRALVLCDSGGLVPVSAFVRGVVALFVRFFAAGARGAPWFARVFAWYYRYLVLPQPAAATQRERIIASAYEIAPVLHQAWQSFARPGADLRALAASLELPIWCAWSGSDRVIPLWMCRPAIARMRRARLSVFKGGHSAFLEQPDEFLRELRIFLAQLTPAQAGSAVSPRSAASTG